MKDLFSLAPCWDDRGVRPHPSNPPPLPLIGVFQDILEVSFGGFVVVFFGVLRILETFSPDHDGTSVGW